MEKYDVIIVGTGPAAIFTALELIRQNDRARVLMLEKGLDIGQRQCLAAERKIACHRCQPCALLSGWGGAGAYSDGKLTLSSDVGGSLAEYLSPKEMEELICYVDQFYCGFGAPEYVYGTDAEAIIQLQRKASLHNLTLIPSRIRHMGTDQCLEVLKAFRQYLDSKVEARFTTPVQEILIQNGSAIGVRTGAGEKIFSDFVVVAPGRVGANWLKREADRLHLITLKNPVDIGVRVEAPAAVMEPLTQITYEPKLIFHSRRFDDRVRTFCMNPYGKVVNEYCQGIHLVNGHSYARSKTENTNFALLVSTNFTEPFDRPISYGRYLARLANLLSGGIIVQRLGDLLTGRRSTADRIKRNVIHPSLPEATPGDLSFVLPYRYLSNIIEMLEVMDNLAPGLNSRHTLLYGLEVKFYSLRLKLTQSFETPVSNLYAIGDGAGLTRGLMQASISGVVAARSIKRKMHNVEQTVAVV
ncbi:MAG: NAD(P)/FAD-dependent oxidoreductase [bacterium]